MKETVGELWFQRVDAVCITTNGYVNKQGDATMGRGCALQARAMFPGIARELGNLITATGNHVYRLATPRHGWYDGENGEQFETEVVSFPVKHKWNEKADLELIKRSAHELVKLSDEWFFGTVMVPRPGCGNGQLSWGDVGPVLAEILDDRFTAITF